MKKLISLIAMVAIVAMGLLLGCNNASTSDESTFLLINTVDEQNNPMKAQIAKWWFSDKPEEKTTLSCDQTSCSEWTIQEKISSPVTFYAHATQVKENDENCWDWFEGEIEIKPSQKESVLTLSHSETVCK